MSETYRALLIEENRADAISLKRLLKDSSRSDKPSFGTFSVDAVGCLGDALQALTRNQHDVVLLDLTLPNGNGIEGLRQLHRLFDGVPVVVLTAPEQAQLELEALSLGAQDFLHKGELDARVIARSLRHAIERWRAQARILSALREKEVMFRELNHRAKNNLQVITALLSMQARRSDDQSFRALVSTARERIASMALAHEKLTMSESGGELEFSDYLGTLAAAVHKSHGGEGRRVTLHLDLGGCRLALARAVTAGLVVNELLTNAFKHAFPPGRGGNVWLSLVEQGERLVLTVEDDGVGLREPSTPPSRPLGLELVATLTQQLNATLEHGEGRGTCLTFSFEKRRAR